MAEAQNKVLSTTENKKVEDEYGNIIVVPAGFKIVVDETTNNASHVTEGIVIEDATYEETKGSQFVWVPVGKIYTDKEKTEDSTKTITLGRYSSFEGDDPVPVQSETVGGGFEAEVPIAGSYSSDYTEQKKTESGEETSGNALAQDIVAFCTRTIKNGGYYLGRYEARTNSRAERKRTDPLTTVTCTKDNAVYNWVTQAQALSQSQAMYSGKTFTSDLVNSYAWDTAIVFIQKCGTPNNQYSKQTSKNPSFSKTGTTDDVECNIYDMASNCYEWTTETCENVDIPCTDRGGNYVRSNEMTSSRYRGTTSYSDTRDSFRPILYF